jgi:4-amino-4-deoxychorismate lyase
MLNDKGEVVCGTMTNLFCSRDNVLLTPNLSECGIKGVMRQQVIEVARAADITVKECTIDKRDLMHADDLFLTNSLSGLITVAELDGRRYSQSALTTKIKQSLCALGVEECAA